MPGWLSEGAGEPASSAPRGGQQRERSATSDCRTRLQRVPSCPCCTAAAQPRRPLRTMCKLPPGSHRGAQPRSSAPWASVPSSFARCAAVSSSLLLVCTHRQVAAISRGRKSCLAASQRPASSVRPPAATES